MLSNLHELHNSLYETLEKYNWRPIRSLATAARCIAGARQAHLLHVTPSSAGLHIGRRGFLEDGRAVEFATSWYRGDIYDFVAGLEAD